MGFKPGLTADNEPETLKAQAFSVGQSEYSGQVNDAVRSSATATEFLATDGNPVLQGGEDVIPGSSIASMFCRLVKKSLRFDWCL